MGLIGDMRQSCTLCLNAPVVQGAGAMDNYGALLTTRGKLKASSGDRALTFGDIQGDSFYTLIVRYQAAITVNISISAKWLIDNIFYTIQSWEKIDERNFYYKFKLARKEQNQGTVNLDAITGLGLQDPIFFTVDNGTTIATGLPDNAVIVLVAKTGLIYKPVAGAPSTMEYSYSGGTLTFGIGFNPGEVVTVIYKLV